MKKVLFVALLCILAFTFASHKKIVPEVLNSFDMLAYKKADVMILLKEQVDFDKLTNKDGIHVNQLSWEERGRLVLDEVLRVARMSQGPIINILKNHNIEYRSMYVVNAIFADQVPLSVLEKIADRADVFQIQSNAQVDVDLEEPDAIQDFEQVTDEIEWNVKFINATYLWDEGYTGEGVVIGGSDTGVEFTHPALVSNYRGAQKDGSFDHNYNWWDGTRRGNCGAKCPCASNKPCDGDNHGTHTIGTSIGGVDRKIGVAPGAKWIACRSIAGSATNAESFLSCLQFFLAPHDLQGRNPNPDLRPVSTGHSYGCRSGTTACRHDAWKQSIKALRASGQMVVASAGNAGSRCRTVRGPPGKLDTVFTVGALQKESHVITTFSSRGPSLEENKRKPDICAGGANVVSAIPGNKYAAYSGTSMSCPAVNGAVGLLWSALPELKGNIELTQKIFQETAAHQIDDQCDSGATPNNVYGYGTINIGAAYEMAKTLLGK